MTGDSRLDIRPDDLKLVQTLLRRYVPDRDVRAFGSRVRGTARQFSDLDLVIMGETRLTMAVAAALAEEFSESALPFKVDIVEWASTNPQFRDIIQANWVTVQTAFPPSNATP